MTQRFPARLLVVSITVMAGYWFITDASHQGLFSDGIRYLMSADQLPWISQAHPFAAQIDAASVFPPVFPTLIGLFGGSSQAAAQSLAVSFSIALACAATAWFARKLGLSSTLSLSLGIVFALLPGTLLHSLILVSEYLFIALALAALTLAMDKRYLAAALVTALATLTRLAGLPLLLAIPLAMLKHVPARRGLQTLVLASLPAVAFLIHLHLFGQDNYLNHFEAKADNNLLLHLTQAIGRLPELFLAFASLFSMPTSTVSTVVLLLLCIVAAATALVRLYQLQADALFCVGYLALISFWPYPQEWPRFCLVIVPFFLVYLTRSCQQLGRRISFSVARIAAVSSLVIVLLLALPTLLLGVHRGSMELPKTSEPFRWTPAFFMATTNADAAAIADTLAGINAATLALTEQVSYEQCVYSSFPEYVMYWGRVQSRATPAQIDGPSSLSHCQFVFMIAASSPQARQPKYYPYDLATSFLEPIFVVNNLQGKPVAALARVERDR